MSADRDVTRIVRSWLHEDAHEDADRVLDMVLDLVDTTPQRRASWLARRTPTMNNYARLGLVAAAVLAVVIVGIGLFGRSLDVGPPVGTESPAPSLQPSAAAAVNPLAGTWLAPVNSCEQWVATVEAAGYTADQMTQEGFDPTCANGGTNQFSVVFDGLPLAATIHSARVYDYGELASPHNYRVVDDSTFELGAHDGKAWEFCLTFQFAILGDQLTIHRVAPSCAGTGEAPLNDQMALTGILETFSFTRQP